MQVDIRDFIQRRIYFFGIYEPNLTHYLMRRARPGDHAVDIGANIGYMTLLLSHMVGPRGLVYAVEACPSTVALLKENVRLNAGSNVTVLEAAVTGEPCRVEIIPGERYNRGTNAIRLADRRSVDTVPGVPFRDLPQLDLSLVGVVKIDIEGAEPPVLRDIVANLARLPSLHTLVVEMSEASAPLVEMMIEAGFAAFALPNNYRIGYMLVRRYLARSSEDDFVSARRVSRFSPAYTDYAFERASTGPARDGAAIDDATSAREIERPLVRV